MDVSRSALLKSELMAAWSAPSAIGIGGVGFGGQMGAEWVDPELDAEADMQGD